MFVLTIHSKKFNNYRDLIDANIFCVKVFNKLAEAQRYSDDAINLYHENDADLINDINKTKWTTYDNITTKTYQISFDDYYKEYDTEIKEVKNVI